MACYSVRLGAAPACSGEYGQARRYLAENLQPERRVSPRHRRRRARVMRVAGGKARKLMARRYRPWWRRARQAAFWSRGGVAPCLVLHLGVHFRADQYDGRRDPYPRHEADRCAKRAVSLVVAAEMCHAVGEGERDQHPADGGQRPAPAHPAPARRGSARAIAVDVREPDRQAAALAQGSIIRGRVRDLVPLLRNVVIAVSIQAEGQGGHPGIREGASLLRRPRLQRYRPDPCNSAAPDPVKYWLTAAPRSRHRSPGTGAPVNWS